MMPPPPPGFVMENGPPPPPPGFVLEGATPDWQQGGPQESGTSTVAPPPLPRERIGNPGQLAARRMATGETPQLRDPHAALRAEYSLDVPTGVAASVSYGDKPGDDAAWARALRNHYNADILVERDAQGRRFYRPPDGTQSVLIDRPVAARNIAAGIAGSVPEIVSAIPEGAALLATGGASLPLRMAAGAIGGAAGGGAGEALRAPIGAAIGMRDSAMPSTQDITSAATMGGVFGGAGPAVGAVLGRVFGGGKVPAFLGNVNPRVLEDGLRLTGQRVLTDSPQTVADVAAAAAQSYRQQINAGAANRAELIALEQDALRLAGRARAAEEGASAGGSQPAQQAQIQRGVQAPQQGARMVGPDQPVDTGDVGRRVQAQAGASVQRGVQPAEDALSQAQADARAAVNEVLNGSVRPQDGGTGSRASIEASRLAAEARISQRYAGLDAAKANGGPVLLNNARRMAERWQRIVQSGLNIGADEDLQLINRLFAQTRPQHNPNLTQMGDSRPFSEMPAASFHDLDRAISLLARRSRTLPPEVNNRLGAELDSLAAALRADREAGLRAVGGDAAVNLQQTNDRALSALRAEFDRNLLGRLTARDPRNTRYMVDDSQVFDAVFGASREEVGRAARRMDGPTRERIAAAIRQRWADTVAPNGVVDEAAHARFMRQYGDAMAPFLSPAEMASVGRASAFQTRVAETAARRDEVRAALGRSLEGRVANMDSPEAVTRAVLTMDPSQVRRVMTIARGDPGLEGQIIASARQDLLHRTSSGGVVNGDALMRGLAAGTKEGDTLRALLPPEQIRHLERIAAELSLAQRQPARMGAVESTKVNVIRSLARAYVGLFTTEGRVMTAAQRAMSGSAQQALERAVMDPAYLADLARLSRMTPGSRAARDLAASLGLEAFTQ